MGFEARTRALAVSPWFNFSQETDDGGCSWCLSWLRCWPRRAVIDLLTLYLFWVIVWGVKMVFGWYVVLDAVVISESLLIDAVVVPLEERWGLANGVHAGHEVLIFFEPARVIKNLMSFQLWVTGLVVFLADTRCIYQVVLALWGGLVGLGVPSFLFETVLMLVRPWKWQQFVAAGWKRVCRRRMIELMLMWPWKWCDRVRHWNGYTDAYIGAVVKLLPMLAPTQEEQEQLDQISKRTGWDSWTCASVRERCRVNDTGSKYAQTWRVMWAAIVKDLHDDFLITDVEREELTSNEKFEEMVRDGSGRLFKIANQEARRRLHFFTKSLHFPDMPASRGALECPGITVVVPVFQEVVTPTVRLHDFSRLLVCTDEAASLMLLMLV